MDIKQDNRICIRLPQDILNELELIKKATNCTTTAAIKYILRDFLNKNEDLLDSYFTKINEE